MYEDMTKDELIRNLERSREKLGTCTLHNPTLCHCIYDVIQAGVVVHDREGTVVFCNTMAMEILGLDANIHGNGLDGPGRNFLDGAGAGMAPRDYPVYRAIAEKKPVDGVVVKYSRPQTDNQRWLRMNAMPLIIDGQLEQVIVSFVDITAEITATLKMKESEECFRAVFEHAVTGIILLQRSGQIVNANATMENMLGYPVAELTSLNLWDISFPDDFEIDRELLLDVIEGRRQYYQIEKRYVSQSGALIWGMLTTSAVRDESGAPRFIVNMIEDISASKFAEERLHYLNTHDSMTGLRNRAWFDEEFNRLHYGMIFPVSIITIDLDGLKQINDSQGHEAGDALIIGAATILREAFRGQDIAARVGGDEFGVLLPAMEEAAAKAMVERIRECQDRFNETRHGVQVLFSIGTATAHSSGKVAGLWKEADEHMYAEKALHKRLCANNSTTRQETCMVYLEWNNDFLIGNKELDGHHMHLVDLLNRAYTICVSHTTPADLLRIVGELNDYVKYHFAAEEHIMGQHGYPGLPEQQREHDEFKHKLSHLKDQISGTASVATIEAVELTQMLADWVKGHIMTVDKKLGEHLNGM